MCPHMLSRVVQSESPYSRSEARSDATQHVCISMVQLGWGRKRGLRLWPETLELLVRSCHSQLVTFLQAFLSVGVDGNLVSTP